MREVEQGRREVSGQRTNPPTGVEEADGGRTVDDGVELRFEERECWAPR